MREGHSSVLKKGSIIAVLAVILLLLLTWIGVACDYIDSYLGIILYIIPWPIVKIGLKIYSLHQEKKKETEKSIEEKLEKFYSPYVQNMGSIHGIPYWRHGMEKREDALSTLKKIRNYTYLTLSEETRRVVEKYFDNLENSIDKTDIDKKLQERADELVKREYNQLLDKLENK